jgi:eukaryotic-like serine/threonine-protein kinase
VYRVTLNFLAPPAPTTGAEAPAPQQPSTESAPRPGVLAPGSRFGEYEIGACIGEGGMARVYSATHPGLKRPIALKVLTDGQGAERSVHERFLREGCIAAAIKHPNVVNIFDLGVHAGTPYLVMELLEGEDLETLLRTRRRLDEATIVDVLVPIVAGLAAVHDAGVVHRDLKPSNIFLARGRDQELEPRLLDFGISKALGSDALKLTAAPGLLLGTPLYMSPEGVSCGEMTPLSDQYALGVVLYECATGVNPFAEATSFSDVLNRVWHGQFPAVASLNPELSPRLVAIIERAMQLDPARRFPDVRALGRELLLLAGERLRVTWNLSFTVLGARGLQARTPAPAASPSPPRVASRAARRLPWAALAVVALGFSWASAPLAQRAESPLANAAEASALAPAAVQAEVASPTLAPVRVAPLIEVQTLASKPAPPQRPLERRTEPQPSTALAPARAAPAPADSAASGGAAKRRPTQFGTNRAPIFD